VNWIHELFRDLPRQGPGDDDCTRRALGLCGELPPRPRVLDLGCGTGMQTLELARSTGGHVVAVDNHAPYLAELRRRAEAEGLSERIETLEADLHGLEPTEAPYDLVWSEGAIWVVGFENGLRRWRAFLRPGGPLAVSEMVWLTATPPEPCRRFFETGYPQMTDLAGNLRSVERAGFTVSGHFTVPDAIWWQNYYEPLERRLDAFEREHGADAEARGLAGEVRTEIEIFRRYSRHYGYVFFAMRRSD